MAIKAATKQVDGHNMIKRVSIRPGVNILTVLPHLNYKPWFAIAEFVDNALQSFLANKSELKRIEGRRFRLQIDIIFDSAASQILIRDNAAGICASDFQRAFKAAEIPPDAAGLSEFGMGMKSAACWFTKRWSVRSSALGEPVERTVSFDIHSIVRAGVEELEVETRVASREHHFTEVRLIDVPKFPKTNTIAKIREHLADIYRCFIRSGELQLHVNGERLDYQEPEVLNAPFFQDENGSSREWRLDIDIPLEGGKRAHGFAGIRSIGSTSRAGFALFRRNRLIQGSADEGYRPEQIFGRSNSYAYQRVFGEIHLKGFSVSHTKDGIQWSDAEEEFLTKLERALSQKQFPLLQQANGFRAKAHAARLGSNAETAVAKTAQAIGKRVAPVLANLNDAAVSPTPLTLPEARESTARQVQVRVDGWDWEISVELSYDPDITDWLTIGDHEVGNSNLRRLALRVSMAHPFMERFASNGPDELEALLRVAAAVGLAEVRAQDGGLRKAGTIRRNVNELLREALSKP
jgi:hypothetical protein